jgi:hypothetical protein
LPNQLHSQTKAARLISNHAQQVIGICMARVGFHNLSVQLFGLWKTTGLMMLDSLEERVRDSWHSKSTTIHDE